MAAGRPSASGPADRDTADRFVAAIGFVLAGFGIASSFLEWTEAVAYGPIESVPGLAAALVMFGAFAAGRYGIGDRRRSLVAGIGAMSLVWAAAVALLYPVATGAGEVTIGPGIGVGFFLGVLGTGIAYAEYLGLDREEFLRRSQLAMGALGIGIFGLFVGFGFSAASVSLYSGGEQLIRSGISTAAFSVGLGVVALGFIVVTDREMSFLDIAWPGKWDWAYIVGGVAAMFAILFGLGWVAEAFGLPSAQHGLVEAARENPALLLPFIPLSWLAIGPGEELLSRNIVQKYLYDGYARYSAVIVATLVFTVIHLPAYLTAEPAAVFTTLLRLFAISLVLGVVYERTKNVVVAALVHGTYDAIQFGLAYISLVGGYL